MGAKIKLQRFITRIRIWWNEPIFSKPVIDHNTKQIVMSGEKPLVNIRARLITLEGRFITGNGNSRGITLNPTLIEQLTKESRTVQLHTLEIEEMQILDNVGDHIKKQYVNESAILTTRLLTPQLEKEEPQK